MTAPEILIIAPEEEPHAQSVYQYLRQKHDKISISILDTAHFPQKTAWQISVNSDSMQIEIPDTEKPAISLGNLKSIWWWRPQCPVISPQIRDQGQMRYAYKECCQMIECLWYLVDCLWVNQPERQEVALNRMYQLEAAKMVGFKILDTVVTSHPQTVLDFWEKHGRKIMYRQMLPISPKNFVFFEKDIARLKNLPLAPLMFQETIKLDALLHIIVIGEALFPIRVVLPSGTKNRLMKKYVLPDEIMGKILNLTRQTGLIYSKLTMGIDKNSNYVFLEMDPMASFLELEQEMKLHLTARLGDILLGGKVKETQRFWPTLPKLKKAAQNE